MSTLIFYMDESGNRNPDKKADETRKGRDWFGFGGYIADSADEGDIKSAHAAIAQKWGVKAPFHITEMLAAKGRHSWIGRLSEVDRERFWSDYKSFLAALPVLGLACVIDRPGYVARGYLEKHGSSRWLLCRSAFDIAIERAAKYAISKEKKLSVVFESDPPINETVKGYFQNLKNNGLEFDPANSGKYQPLSKEEFASTLSTIEYKQKSSTMLQIADSYIYSLSRGKYDRLFPIYRRLRDAKRIMEFALGDVEKIKAMGCKYYCFD